MRTNRKHQKDSAEKPVRDIHRATRRRYSAEDGTWRQQTKACEIDTCALHPYRPKPYKVRNQAAGRDSEAIGATPGSGMGSGVASHFQAVGGGK